MVYCRNKENFMNLTKYTGFPQMIKVKINGNNIWNKLSHTIHYF